MRSRYDRLDRKRPYSSHLSRVRAAASVGRRDARMSRLMAARSVVRRGGFGPAGPGAMEYKSIDTRMNATAVDNGSAVLLLNGCARGDDINERTGRRTTMVSLEAKIYTYATTTTGASQIHRHLLVLDTQPNGSALTPLQVLSAADTFSSRNLENRARFRVLMDRRFSLSAATLSGSRRVFKFYKRLHIPVTYNGGDAGTVADIVTNSLYWIGIGSEAAGPTAGAAQGFFRVRFTDQ